MGDPGSPGALSPPGGGALLPSKMMGRGDGGGADARGFGLVYARDSRQQVGHQPGHTLVLSACR